MAHVPSFFEEDEGQDKEGDEGEGEKKAQGLTLEEVPCLAVRVEVGRQGGVWRALY